jgi:NO-binding membrane sensor protein with MHYT domain
MLVDFFQIGPLPVDYIQGSYHFSLLLLTYLVAVFASYLALEVTSRLRDFNTTPFSRFAWVVGGACAIGGGVWAMQILAFSLSGMVLRFDKVWTSLSAIVAIISPLYALYILITPVVRFHQLVLAGVLVGVGIAAMHYFGLQAMKASMNIHYLRGYFIFSIIIALTASVTAFYLALKSNFVRLHLRMRLRIISSLTMGAAICGTFYVGTLATVFPPLIIAPTQIILPMEYKFLASGVAVLIFILIVFAFFIFNYKKANHQSLLNSERQKGMAEVAANVLHNMGNVLNSLSVSSNLLREKIKKSKLNQLSNLSEMLNEHKDFKAFMMNDERALKIPIYVKAISDYWKEEQLKLTQEVEAIINNLQFIKSIISAQQDLSQGTPDFSKMVSIEAMLEESLLILSFDYKKDNIKIEKKYGKIKPVFFSKVKLSQIFENLLLNAREAMACKIDGEKVLTLEVGADDENTIFIKIKDTGVGVANENLKQIFTHGFSTKPSGHGFGLHVSALAIKEMNGNIKVESEGIGQGATFTILLPSNPPHVK